MIYSGQIELTSGKTGYRYEVENPAEGKEPTMIFGKRLIGYETIGTYFLAEETPTGVKGPYEIDRKRKADPSLVEQWSIREKAFVETKKLKRELKVQNRGHIDALIDAVYLSAPRRSERTAIALYIYNKLVNV